MRNRDDQERLTVGELFILAPLFAFLGVCVLVALCLPLAFLYAALIDAFGGDLTRLIVGVGWVWLCVSVVYAISQANRL